MKIAIHSIVQLILMVLVSTTLWGQFNLSGTVYDSKHKGISGATILLLKSADSVFVTATAADNNGTFMFSNLPASNYLLKVSSLSTKDTMFRVNYSGNGNLHINILLEQGGERKLKDVVVKSGKPLIQLALGKILFNPENLISTAGDNVYETLKKAPLVSADEDGNISIKGQKGAGVMVNGRLLQLSGNQLKDYLRSIPAQDIAQIEVITSPSAKYDAEGISGLINIVLKKSNKIGLTGNVSPSYEQTRYAKYSLPLSLNYRTEKWNLFGGTTLNTGKYYSINQIDNIFSRNTTPYYSYSKGNSLRDRFSIFNRFGADYTINSNNIIGVRFDNSIGTSNGDELNKAAFQKAPDVLADSLYNTLIGSKNRSTSYSANLNYKATLDTSGQSLSFNADYYNYNVPRYSTSTNASIYDKVDPGNPTSNIFFNNQSTQKINIYSGQLDYSKNLAKSTTLELGTKLYHLTSVSNLLFSNGTPQLLIPDSARSNHFDYKENNFALYGNLLAQLNSKWGIQVGLRAEKVNIDGKAMDSSQKVHQDYLRLFPSVMVQYNRNDNNQFSFSYTNRTKRPNYSYLNPSRYYSNPNSYTEGNPFLLPAISNNFDLNYTLKQKYTFDLFLFLTNNQLTQITSLDTSNKSYKYLAINVKHSYLGGFQTYIPVKIMAWWQSSITFLILWNGVRSTIDNALYKYNNFNCQLQAYNQFKLSKKENISGELNFLFQPAGMSQGEFISDRVLSLSGGLRKSFKDKRSSLAINVNDIFNTAFVPVRVDKINQYTKTYGNFDRRGVRITFAYNFGKLTIKKARDVKTSNEEEKARAR